MCFLPFSLRTSGRHRQDVILNHVRVVILCLLMCGFGISLRAQIVYTADFTRLLQKANLSYAEPTEQWLHVTVPPLHEYMDYDLVLENDRSDFEVRYRIHRVAPDPGIPAAIEVSRLAASLASNEPDTEIRIQIPPDSLLKSAFNADRGIIAHFRPKQDFSQKSYATFISLYADGRPGIDIILLYNDPLYDPLNMYRNVAFRD